jgi:hypothetical protein
VPRANYFVGCADFIERQLKQPLRRVSPGAKERNPRATPLLENLPKAEQKNAKGIKKRYFQRMEIPFRARKLQK